MIDVLRIMIGPLAWLASFSAVYGLHGIGCGFGWGEISVRSVSFFRLALVAAWLGAVAVQIVVLSGLHSRRFASSSEFVRGVSKATGWVGLVATLWSLFPVAVISSCD